MRTMWPLMGHRIMGDLTLTLMCAAEENKKNGWDMRIHVDGASGAMIAPFIYPGVGLAFAPHCC